MNQIRGLLGNCWICRLAARNSLFEDLKSTKSKGVLYLYYFVWDDCDRDRFCCRTAEFFVTIVVVRSVLYVNNVVYNFIYLQAVLIKLKDLYKNEQVWYQYAYRNNKHVDIFVKC